MKKQTICKIGAVAFAVLTGYVVVNDIKFATGLLVKAFQNEKKEIE